jgi:hypothetical protein
MKHTRGDNLTTDLCGEKTLNEYEVTYVNGEVVQIEAWTPELAEAVAEEEAESGGRALSVASVKLLAAQSPES